MLITFPPLHIPVHAKVQYIIKLLLCDKQNKVNPQVKKHPMNTLVFDSYPFAGLIIKIQIGCIWVSS